MSRSLSRHPDRPRLPSGRLAYPGVVRVETCWKNLFWKKETAALSGARNRSRHLRSGAATRALDSGLSPEKTGAWAEKRTRARGGGEWVGGEEVEVEEDEDEFVNRSVEFFVWTGRAGYAFSEVAQLQTRHICCLW